MPLVSKSTPFTQQKERISDCRPIWISPLWYQTQVLLSIESFVCILGVSLGQVIFTSSQLLTHLAKFDLLLDRVGGGGRGQGNAKNNFHFPTPSPLLPFAIAHPSSKNSFLSPGFHCCKNQRWWLYFPQGKYWTPAHQNCTCSAGCMLKAYQGR